MRMGGDDMADADEQKGYEVVDKRKVKLGKDGEIEAEPEPNAQPGPETEARAQGSKVDERPDETASGLPPVDVYSLLKSFIGILGSHAWSWLGLVKDPITGKLDKDLAQAKVAIDTIAALSTQLESKLDDSEKRELQAMLSDLRMNFVRQSASGS